MVIGLIMFGHKLFPLKWASPWAILFLAGYMAYCGLVYWLCLKVKDSWKDYRLMLVLPVLLSIGLGSLLVYAAPSRGVMLMTLFFWTAHQYRMFCLFVSIRRHAIDTRAVRSYSPLRSCSWWKRLLEFSNVDAVEDGSFLWYILSFIVAVAVYCLGFLSAEVALFIGSFSILTIAFTVLTGIGNFLTCMGMRYKVNLHLMAILFAMLLGYFFPNPHDVQLETLPQSGMYKRRPDVKEQLYRWMERNEEDLMDTACTEVRMFLVMADGGAVRSAYWTAGILGKLEDTTQHAFSRNLFAVSGASGGTVGNGVFYSLLYQHYVENDTSFTFFGETDHFLRNDFLSPALATYAGTDFLRYFIPLYFLQDRAAALEKSFCRKQCSDRIAPVMDSLLSRLFLNQKAQQKLPLFFMNTTRSQDGYPGVISSVSLSFLPQGDRLDVVDNLERWHNCNCCGRDTEAVDLRLSTALIMSSRFPYVTPAGCIGNHCFVDGGYFDNSGAGITLELIHELNRIMKQDTTAKWYPYYHKVKFCVLHFRNSSFATGNPPKLHPLINGWLAPLITTKASWVSQTEINNNRLKRDLEGVYNGKWVEFSMIRRDEKMTQPLNMSWAISNHHIDQMRARMKETSNRENLEEIIRLCR